jgi:hypothetical protein
MKRNLGLERVFKLGEFKSMRVTSDVSDIPEDVVMDKEAMSQIRLLQLVETDKAFYQYRLQAETLNGFETDDERFALLVEQEAQIYTNIQARIELLYSTKEE